MPLSTLHLNLTVVDVSTCKFGAPPCAAVSLERTMRCSSPETFTVYLYPPPLGFNMSDHARDLFEAIRSVSRLASSPEEACISIPQIDTLCVHNHCKNTRYAVEAYLWSLPSWNSGRHHVLFHFADHEFHLNYGFAMLAKSSFGPDFNRSFFGNPDTIPGLQQQRFGYDIAFPLPFYRCKCDRYAHLHQFDGTPIPPIEVSSSAYTAVYHSLTRTCHIPMARLMVPEP